MNPSDYNRLCVSAEKLLDQCREAGLYIATAESCTGGLIASVLTEIPGSSDVFERGFVTYSNAAKSELLGVPPEMIETHGAVSAQVAEAMADGALKHSNADLAVSVTGIAGPDGGSAAKPVGLVYLGVAQSGHPTMTEENRFGPLARNAIRFASVERAFALLAQSVGD